ncbi:ABC transporter permease [Allostreptomyces psammosilenae]|uniref:ABC transporter permease n=1 Tax=Allostreptomyces psammosilenae TaxID=1892865 RepID=UPI001FEBA8A0|nr:ABC transporter permease [Allostreptomyces psammosilenae]
MARLVGRRALAALPVLLGVSLLMFAIGAASPFDPVHAYAGSAVFTASEETLAQLRESFGVDRPWPAQWWDWFTGALTGDLGDSRALRQPVAQVIAERLGWSVLLAGVAFLLTLLLGLLLGTLAARRPGGLVDRAATSLSLTLSAAPAFWLALLAIWLFALRLDWLPAGGLTDAGSTVVTPGQLVSHLTLPALVLAVSQTPWFTLFVRESLLAALEEDFVTGARARGLAPRTVLVRHALRSALLPFVTLVGSRVPELITGALLVETVFSWPGVAGATVEAALAVDFPLLAALTLLATGAVLLGNLLADVLYGLVDPRTALDG